MAVALAGHGTDELARMLAGEARRSGRPLSCADMPADGGLSLTTLESLMACTAALAGLSPHFEIDEILSRFLLLTAKFGIKRAVLAVLPDGDTAVGAASIAALAEDMEAFGAGLGFEAFDVIALDRNAGGQLCNAGWYEGPALSDLLTATGDIPRAAWQPFRMLVDASPGAETDLIEGRLVWGQAIAGEPVILLPAAAEAGVRSATPLADGRLRLQLDRQVAVRTGDVIAGAAARPEVADQMAAHLIWFGSAPLLPGRRYDAFRGEEKTTAQVSALKYRLDAETLEHAAADRLEHGEIGYCNLSLASPVVFDPFDTCRETGRVIVADAQSGKPVGLALISHALRRATNIHWQALDVDRDARAALKGQRPCCLWFTGLSGSGKSAVASLLEKRLQSLGRHTYTLDGDNVRHGLNRDLGFTDGDRVENVRRVAEVSKLFVDAGLIVMCSFISPFRAERRLARDLFAEGEFLEVFVDTPLEICEQRDIKGLYKKARAGELKNFTGIDSPFERPENAELTLEGGSHDAKALVEIVFAELKQRGMI